MEVYIALGSLTLRQFNNICKKHPNCLSCPLFSKKLAGCRIPGSDIDDIWVKVDEEDLK